MDELIAYAWYVRLRVFHPLVLISLALEAAIVAILLVDRAFAMWVKERVAELPPSAHLAIEYITEAGDSKWWLIPSAALFVVLAVLKSHNLARWCFAMFASVGASGLLVLIIKPLIGRYRPKLLHEQDQYGFEYLQFAVGYDTNSFPSGHATTIAAACTVLWCMLPRWRVVWVALWFCVISSRVLLSAHFVGDVFAGTALGMGTAALVLCVWSRRFPLSMPNAITQSA